MDHEGVRNKDSAIRAPLLTAHTMDGCSIGQQPDVTFARAPVLLSQTIDGHVEYSAPRPEDVSAYIRAPILSVHTIDNSQYQYAIPAKNNGTVVEYNAADINQHNTQNTGEMLLAQHEAIHPTLFCTG